MPIATSRMDPRMARPARTVMRPESTAKRRPLIHGTRPVWGPSMQTQVRSAQQVLPRAEGTQDHDLQVSAGGQEPEEGPRRGAAALPWEVGDQDQVRLGPS